MRLVAIASAMLAASLATAFAADPQQGSQPQAGANASVTAKPTTIAIALPLSGPQKSVGRNIQLSVELAFETLADHDKTKRKINLEWIDDHCSSEGGEAGAQQIVAMNPLPAAVIGHACPSAAATAAPLYDAAHIVHITIGSLPAREPQTKRSGPAHFRLPGDGPQGTPIGEALVAAGAAARIAFVRDGTLQAQTILQPALAVLAMHGQQPVATEVIAGGSKDFTALVQRLVSQQTTHIALALYPSEGALLITELHKQDPSIKIISSDLLADPAFARLAGSAADGVLVALRPNADAFPAAASLQPDLAARGATATRASLSAYAAMEVIITAMKADGGLADAVAKGAFNTVLGAVRFDANGAALMPVYVFYTWQNGRLQPPEK